MAQPLIKFFKVASLTGVTTFTQGGIYFVTDENVLYVATGTTADSLVSYSGVRDASKEGEVLTIVNRDGNTVTVNLGDYLKASVIDSYSTTTLMNAAIATAIENLASQSYVEDQLKNYVAKTLTIAGIDLQDNIEAAELKTALGLTEQNLAGEANKIEVVKVNGTAVEIKDKAVDITVPTKLSDLTNDGNYVTDANYVHTDNNYTTDEKTKLAGIEAGAEVNTIETVKVNGVALTPDADRAVDVIIPDAAVKSVKANDKVLKLEDTELSTELSLVYETQGEGDAAKKYIVLKGINDVEITKIDASDFIADSFLNDVELDDEDNLQFTWVMANGATKTDTVNIAKYIDTYTAGNGIDITDKKVSVKVDPTSESFLSVGEAGVQLSGVQTAINTAAAKATTVVVEGTDAGNNLSIEESKATDGHYVYTVNLTDVASAQGLSDLSSLVSDNERVTASALVNLNERINTVADSIPAELGVMKVTKGTDGEFVTTAIEGTDSNPTVGVSVTYTESNADAKALATDAYVNEQIQTAITNLVTAEGDDLVSATASGNKVTVASTQGLKDAVSAANSAVQSVTSTGNTIQVTTDTNTVNVELAWTQF